MGCVINPSASTPEQLTVYQQEERAAIQRLQEARQRYDDARAAEDRYLRDNPPPPPANVPVNYYNDLWKLTAPAATNEGSVPHPELPGASSSQIHASQGLELKERDWAAQQNAQQAADETAIYHTQAPVIVYNTNIDANGFVRLHHDYNQVGDWSTRDRDVNYGHIDQQEAASRLSLPQNSPLPTHISDLSPPIGTSVEASRPISGEAMQFNIHERIATWFSNPRPLG